MSSVRRRVVVIATAAACVLSACSNPSPGGEGPITVYATTGYLADAVAVIAPEAEVTTMVGPGGDPHTYQPSTRDIETIQRADVVLWNGLHLEAQMEDLLEGLGDRQLAVAELLPAELLLEWPEVDAEGNALHDPHVWNSPEAWSLVVGYVADEVSAADPERADQYARNAAAFQDEIAAAAAEAGELLESVPEPRILITGHDAFSYFGQTYDLEVRATDFVSTDAALSATELSGLAGLIAEHEVPVIFQDNQANPQAITSLQEAVRAQGWEVEISEQELYADSLGGDAGVDTYLGVFRHNAAAIADALGGEQQ